MWESLELHHIPKGNWKTLILNSQSFDRLYGEVKSSLEEQNNNLCLKLRFVTFVHLPFSVRSLDLFVASLVFMKGTSCCVIKRNF